MLLLAQSILLYGENVQATEGGSSALSTQMSINRAWVSLTGQRLYVAPVSGEVKGPRVSENSAVGDFITESLHIASVCF